ncbi:chorismate synthase [Lentisphaerota bacterium ZTH]|nr:chorismate synthase [Lentisphaerota bacterium]WET07612.1 chorismate synthase [Lentisphaerota bacterium ZTH]
MSGSSIGKIFKVTTFGESHGAAVGVIVDGVTPGVELCENDVQKELDRRKPGQSSVTTQRKESDTVHFLSGVFEGKTTGTPLAMIIYNADQRSKDYDNIKDLFRPGHADYTYLHKYGIRDYRGSGRASGRETAGRVAAGAVASKILAAKGINITAYTLQIGKIRCKQYKPECIDQNIVRACDPDAAPAMIKLIEQRAAENNSTGGIVECRINGVPAGTGEPVFDKLDAELAKAIVSLGGVKGIEFGAGFAAVEMSGSEHNDEMTPDGFASNNAGGIIGGISTGNEIILRAAIKPTSSISRKQQTVNIANAPVVCETHGRHDPCLCPRIVPVVEAMCAITVLDMLKQQAAMLA